LTRESSRGSAAGGDSLPIHRQDILWLAAILIFALAIRLFFYRGIVAVDDFNYLRHAAEVWKGRFELESILYWHGTRPLVFVPISWCFALFGVSEASATAWPIVASLFTVALMFSIGRSLYGRESAIYAAIMAAFMPMLVNESTRVLPGVIINLVIALSVYCFIHSEQVLKGRGFWLLFSGLLFGAMPWAGRLGLVFFCFFPLAVLLLGRYRFLSYWPVAIGFLGMLFLNVLHQWLATGDPFFNNAIAQKILISEMPRPRNLFYLKLMIRPLYTHGSVFYLAAAGGVLAILSRRRELIFMIAWFTAMWLILEFGSSSIREYRPLFKEVRFMSLLAIPGVLLAGRALAELRLAVSGKGTLVPHTTKGAVVAVTVLVLVFGSSVVGLEKSGRWMAERRAALHAMRDHIRTVRGGTIYVTHWIWNTRVGFYMEYAEGYFPSGYDPYHAVLLEKVDRDSKNRYIQTLTPGEELAPGLLLHDEDLFRLSRDPGRTGLHGTGEIPEVMADPPETWRFMDRIKIGRNNVVALYQIPRGTWPKSDNP
jgi:hypothetical protein